MKERKIETAWIGLNDIRVEGQYVWVSGVQNSYINWRKIGPNPEPNGGRKENCGQIVELFNGYHWEGLWNDYTCGTQLNFICEKMV